MSAKLRSHIVKVYPSKLFIYLAAACFEYGMAYNLIFNKSTHHRIIIADRICSRSSKFILKKFIFNIT